MEHQKLIAAQENQAKNAFQSFEQWSIDVIDIMFVKQYS